VADRFRCRPTIERRSAIDGAHFGALRFAFPITADVLVRSGDAGDAPWLAVVGSGATSFLPFRVANCDAPAASEPREAAAVETSTPLAAAAMGSWLTALQARVKEA
jgi:hypothetical protein